MYYNNKNINRAKLLRANMTKEENIIWQLVRAKRFLGYKFKRQVLIGDYIVDFVCKEKMLIIEIDGGQHNDVSNIEYDRQRTLYLNSNGYKVLRFWNNEVTGNLHGVCEVIKKNLEQD